MGIAFYILVITLILLALDEAFRRVPRIVFGVTVIILPLLSVVWLIGSSLTWFGWAKAYSLVLGIAWIVLCRLTDIGQRRAAKIISYLILAINIFEAVAVDVVKGQFVNYLNAFAGVLLVFTLRDIDSITVDRAGKNKDFLWDKMSLGWILGYTIWNYAFVYLNYNSYSIDHAAVLGAALIVGVISSGRWLQARAITLGIYILYKNTFWDIPFFQTFDVQWGNNQVELAFAVMSVSYMVGYVFSFYSPSSKLLWKRESNEKSEG